MVAHSLLPALVLGLSVAVSLVTSCPEECSCNYDDKKSAYAIDCSSRGLTTVPPPGTTNAYSLDMSGNQLTSIPSDLRTTHPNVEEFNFENNRISELSSSAFSGLKLKRLKLNGNRIEEIRHNTFRGVQGQCDPRDFVFTNGLFRYVNIGHWGIMNLNEVVEWPCAIDLRGNPISNVRTHAFSESQNYTVYLGESQVGLTIETAAFADTDNILGVHMVKVPSLTLADSAFEGMNVVGWFVIDQTEISLTQNIFSTNTRPRMIRISSSNVLQLESSALTMRMEVEKHCQEVTSEGGAKGTTSTIFSGAIEIVNNTLPALPSHLIKNSLIAGIFFKDNIIGGFQTGVFEREENHNTMCILRFTDNKFETIPSNSFQKIFNIRDISISSSSLISIEADAFAGSRNIRSISIDIKDNENIDQVRIKAYAFRDVRGSILRIGRKSEKIGLSSNKPELIIEPFAFSGLSDSSITLDMIYHLSMQVLPDNLFTGLTNSGAIHLWLYNISRIGSTAFGGPGESSIGHVEVFGIHNFPCDCETAQLNVNIKENVKKVSGLTCSAPFDDGTMSHAWKLDHATCGASSLYLSTLLVFILVVKNLVL